MAFQFKVTAQYGKTGSADIVIAAGASEAQSDTISLNVDVTNMGKAEVLHLLDKLRDQVHAAPFPPL